MREMMSLYDDILLDIQLKRIQERFRARDLMYNQCSKTGRYLIGNGDYRKATLTTSLSNLGLDADGLNSGFHVK
jgi:hypothetical protein